MPMPLLKEDPDLSPELPLSRPPGPFATPEILAKASRLEQELGRPLRLDIDGPLTEEEDQEVILARLAFDKPDLAEKPPEELPSPLPPLSRPPGPLATAEMVAEVSRLEQELGRPLRLHIDGPLTEEEEEEIVLARLTFETPIPASEFLKKHGLK